MLTYLEISLFESPAQTLVNTVNTVGVMGKGIAADFKRIYPQMFEEYHKFCQAGRLNIGKLYIYRTENKIIVNFPTKKHWREKSRVEYIEKGLKKFIDHYMEFGISSVSFPQLGCGHGELDWQSQVQPVMERSLETLPIPVYIHLYPKPTDFIPERLDKDYAREVLKERQQISIDIMWGDLSEIIERKNATQRELKLFDTEANVTHDRISVTPPSGELAHIYRENIENLWQALLITGTISIEDVKNELQRDDISDWLMHLWSQLPYVKPVKLRLRSIQKPLVGLRYQPLPRSEAATSTDHALVI